MMCVSGDYSKRLTLLYLCNDIVQTCKRKHAVMYKDAFKEVLRDVALLIRYATGSMVTVFVVVHQQTLFVYVTQLPRAQVL